MGAVCFVSDGYLKSTVGCEDVADAAVFLRPYVSIGLLTYSEHGITTKLIGLIVASLSLVLK
jgi:hypothetical protein